MTDKHTPGPWRVTGYRIEALRGTVGTVCDAGDDDHEGAFNARLIAQAPTMLRALQRLTHPMADDEDVDHALAVIRAATGQPEPDEDEGPEPPYAGYESEAALRRMAEVRALRELVQYVKDEFSCSHPLRDAADRAHAAISAATGGLTHDRPNPRMRGSLGGAGRGARAAR